MTKEMKIEAIVAELNEKVADKEYTVSATEVVKNNLRTTGLVFKKEGENVCPTFYPNLRKGIVRNVNEIYEQFIDWYRTTTVESADSVKEFADACKSFETAKPYIVFRPVEDFDGQLRKGAPHGYVPGTDIPLVYYLESKGTDNAMTVRITDELMKSWNVDENDILDAALDNLHKEKFVIRDMEEVMAEMIGVSVEELRENTGNMPSQIIISSPTRQFGARFLINEQFMDDLEEKYGTFYILPSSIHECIIIPNKNGDDLETFNNMVREVTLEQVEPKERLSRHAFFYKNGKFIY